MRDEFRCENVVSRPVFLSDNVVSLKSGRENNTVPRSPLNEQLQAFELGTSFREEDRPVLARVRAFLASTPQVFERTHQPGHFTGSGLVFVPEGPRVALMHHRKLGKWMQFGGHADGEQDLAAVALREAREESGLTHLQAFPDPAQPFDLDVHCIPARAHEPEHLHYDVRYLFQASTMELEANSEALEVGWFDLEQAGLRCQQEPSMLRQFDKLRAALKA